MEYRLTALLLILPLAACTAAPDRPANSTYGCAKAVVDSLPPGLTDSEKHCLASAGITQRCSQFESWMAGWGKEVKDAFGGGDPSMQDLAADRNGRRCAAKGKTIVEWRVCCRKAPTAKPTTRP